MLFKLNAYFYVKIGSLQNQLVRLRTEIEKGEEARQNVCFLLNKTQKDLAQLTQLSLKNESVFCRDAEEMNGKCFFSN